MGVVTQHFGVSWVKRPLVNILVVVANIQIRTLEVEVEKGSIKIMFLEVFL